MEKSRLSELSKILFALIRGGLCGEKLPDSIKSQLSGNILGELYSLAEKHDMAHIISEALYTGGIAADNGISEAFMRKQMMAVYRSENRKSEIADICSVLERAKIPYVLLKGAVIRNFYPEEWMRASCDIDILVHEQDMAPAISALEKELEYKAKSISDYHDISLYSPGGVHLELHFSIKENTGQLDGLLGRVWDYTASAKEGSMERLMTPEYFVFHQVAHAAYHFLNGGCGIKPFADLYLIKKQLSFDEQKTRAFCKECGIEVFYDNMWRVADVWFGAQKHTPLTQSIEEYVLCGGAYGSFEKRMAARRGKNEGKLKYAFSRVFLPYDTMKEYYPTLKTRKWMLPLMYIRRLLRLIKKEKLKNGINEIKAYGSVSCETSGSLKEFFYQAGLR